MRTETFNISGPMLVVPDVYADDRGYFFESWSEAKYRDAGLPTGFVQDNESLSCRGVVRGLHYQAPPFAQGKLVRVVRGRVLDVAVDIRAGSPTYGKHVAVELSETDHRELWIPAGFAHGFMALEDDTVFVYKISGGAYDKASERGIRWDDPDIGIAWPLADIEPIVSEKDAALPFLKDIISEFEWH